MTLPRMATSGSVTVLGGWLPVGHGSIAVEIRDHEPAKQARVGTNTGNDLFSTPSSRTVHNFARSSTACLANRAARSSLPLPGRMERITRA